MRNWFATSPVKARVLPFVVFVAITYFQDKLGLHSQYWVYGVKTVVGAWLLWAVWPFVPEMRWAATRRAFWVGIGVFVLWVGLDQYYPKMGAGAGAIWNPFMAFGDNSKLAWGLVLMRFVGSVLIVPPLEEAFFRSFIYRYVASSDWSQVALSVWNWRAAGFSAVIFGFEHHEWLPGILCGLAYQWLTFKRGSLGEAMFAHAITNLALGIFVVSKGMWTFW